MYQFLLPFSEGLKDDNNNLLHEGRYYNLQSIFDRLNREYFGGRIDAKIIWGRSLGKRKLRSIHLGVYDYQKKRITIHPHLDRACIPEYVVESTVFHEMCHQAAGRVRENGMMRHHTHDFHAMEQRYPRHEEAKKWEKENLDLLLRSK